MPIPQSNAQKQITTPDMRRMRDPVALDLTRQAMSSFAAAQDAEKKINELGKNVSSFVQVLGLNEDNRNANEAYNQYYDGMSALNTKAENMNDTERLEWLNDKGENGYQKNLAKIRNNFQTNISKVNNDKIKQDMLNKVHLMDTQHDSAMSIMAFKSRRTVDDNLHLRKMENSINVASSTISASPYDANVKYSLHDNKISGNKPITWQRNLNNMKLIGDSIFSEESSYQRTHGETPEYANVLAQEKVEEAFNVAFRKLKTGDMSENSTDFLNESFYILEGLHKDKSISDKYYQDKLKDLSVAKLSVMSVRNSELIFDDKGNAKMSAMKYVKGLSQDEFLSAVGHIRGNSSSASAKLSGLQQDAATSWASQAIERLREEVQGTGLEFADQVAMGLSDIDESKPGARKSYIAKHRKELHNISDVELIERLMAYEELGKTVVFFDKESMNPDEVYEKLTEEQEEAKKTNINRFVSVSPLSNNTEYQKMMKNMRDMVMFELQERAKEGNLGVFRDKTGWGTGKTSRGIDETIWINLLSAYNHRYGQRKEKQKDGDFPANYGAVDLIYAYQTARRLLANGSNILTGVKQSETIQPDGKTSINYYRQLQKYQSITNVFADLDKGQKEDVFAAINYAIYKNMDSSDYADLMESYYDYRKQQLSNLGMIQKESFGNNFLADYAKRGDMPGGILAPRTNYNVWEPVVVPQKSSWERYKRYF